MPQLDGPSMLVNPPTYNVAAISPRTAAVSLDPRGAVAWNQSGLCSLRGDKRKRSRTVEFSGILGIIHLAVVVYAAVSILGSSATTGQQVLWILLVLLFPVAGLLIWFFAGPKKV